MATDFLFLEINKEIELLEKLLVDRSEDDALKRILIRTLFAGLESMVVDLVSKLGTSISDEVMKDFNYSALKKRIHFVLKEIGKSTGSNLDPKKMKEWNLFTSAIAIRNRITHPKKLTDLIISNKDYETAKSGFMFVLWCLLVNFDKVQNVDR